MEGTLRRTLLLAGLALAIAGPALATDDTTQTLSVVVMERVEQPDPAPDFWTIELAHVAPRGAVTNPSEGEIHGAINTALGTSCPQGLQEDVWPYRVYWGCYWDFITVAIADVRTGRVPFGGWTVWAGTGNVVVPSASSHPLVNLGTQAAPPVSVQVLPNSLWQFPEGPDDALAALRFTDLLHAYAACGDYTVHAYTYVPTVGSDETTVGTRAKLVLLIEGRLGAPWVPVGIEPTSWARVRSLYR